MNEILGLGTDIVDIARIKESIERYKERFLERIFTEAERAYCNRYAYSVPHYAGRFAAKEAIFKALGTGLQKQIHWHDAEIVPDHYGKPEVVQSKHLLTLFPKIHILISISHSDEYATATSIVIRKDSHGT